MEAAYDELMKLDSTGEKPENLDEIKVYYYFLLYFFMKYFRKNYLVNKK